jgi:hypothetical protein
LPPRISGCIRVLTGRIENGELKIKNTESIKYDWFEREFLTAKGADSKGACPLVLLNFLQRCVFSIINKNNFQQSIKKKRRSISLKYRPGFINLYLEGGSWKAYRQSVYKIQCSYRDDYAEDLTVSFVSSDLRAALPRNFFNRKGRRECKEKENAKKNLRIRIILFCQDVIAGHVHFTQYVILGRDMEGFQPWPDGYTCFISG